MWPQPQSKMHGAKRQQLAATSRQPAAGNSATRTNPETDSSSGKSGSSRQAEAAAATAAMPVAAATWGEFHPALKQRNPDSISNKAAPLSRTKDLASAPRKETSLEVPTPSTQ
eukprot:CAMPEP_0172894224 /NCGR_PEP_ID=MMETSP1075-20121228/150397_1 /TAXON_ID=2916 /ORGANISM="Ceratium fusus, Strain PA161109" /LENGTH=112 /DNA_ID=CAMNT_0013749211 /DNA_START=38 /DNA_END=373 /DNA_ORIENTATION=-